MKTAAGLAGKSPFLTDDPPIKNLRLGGISHVNDDRRVLLVAENRGHFLCGILGDMKSDRRHERMGCPLFHSDGK